MILYLKDIMKAKAVTSIELAAQVGVSKTTVSYWISGKFFPTPEKIELIAKALNVPIWRLFVSPDEKVETIDDHEAIIEYRKRFYHKVSELKLLIDEWNQSELDIIARMQNETGNLNNNTEQ